MTIQGQTISKLLFANHTAGMYMYMYQYYFETLLSTIHAINF